MLKYVVFIFLLVSLLAFHFTYNLASERSGFTFSHDALSWLFFSLGHRLLCTLSVSMTSLSS